MNKQQSQKCLASFLMLAAVCIFSICTAVNTHASTLGGGSQSYRLNVLHAAGITDAAESEEACTRAAFAKMLVMASSYHDSTGAMSASAASDVPADYPGAVYIKTALTQGWMRTRLGGGFQPEAAVTLQEAAKATLTMLGYTDSDFPTNLASGRLAKFKALRLDEGVSKSASSETLTMTEATNIIYNLLRAYPKNSNNSIYGSVLDLTLADDNELNATALLEASLVGPILVRTENGVAESVPFALEDATLYYNGTQSGSSINGLRYYSSQINNTGWLIIYYNAASKTVWGYGSDTGNNTYHCIRGRVAHIQYEDDNIASPSSVWIDNTEYILNSADVKFMFSVNGEIKVGDDVVLVCRDNTSMDESTSSYYATAVVKYTTSDGSNTVYSQNIGRYRAVNAAGEDVTPTE